jgi:Mn-containing catalase
VVGQLVQLSRQSLDRGLPQDHGRTRRRSAEQYRGGNRAKIVYERLINFCDDAGTKDALQFLMTREITHMKAFAAALERMEKPAFSIGKLAPTPGLVNQFFNDSTGVGDEGEIDTRGPWNEGGDWEFVQSPALQQEAGA